MVKEHVKKLILVCAILCLQFITCLPASAQAYIRIYDLKGKMQGYGTIDYVTDSSIAIIKEYSGEAKEFLINDIGCIKTKRSIGGSAVIGLASGGVASVGLSLFVILDPNRLFNKDDWDGIKAFVPVCTVACTVVGAVAGTLTKKRKFRIDGDIQKWPEVRTDLLALKKDKFPFR